MKRTVFLRKIQHLLLMAAGSYPLAVLVAARGGEAAYAALPVFVLLFLGFGGCCLLLPGRFRGTVAVAGSGLMLLLAVLLLPLEETKLFLLLPAGYAALLFASLPMGGRPLEDELHPAWPVGGLLAHVLLQILQDHARRQQSLRYAPVAAPLMIGFLLFITLVMLALNRASLKQASQSRVKVPVRMRRQNIALTLALLGIAVAVASLPAIAAFVRRLWDSMIRCIAAVAGWFSALLSGSGGGGGGGGGEMAVFAEAQETSDPGVLQMILEKLLYALALIAAAALLLWLARRLWQKLRQGLGWLWTQLTQYGNAATKDYEDEITDTREDGEYENNSMLKQLRRRFSGSSGGDLTPGQQVRWRYLRLRVKHSEWEPASTARETLPEKAAQLYERVRYGGEELTGEEARCFREDTRRI